MFHEVYDYSKRSPFLKFMVVIMAIPNIILPILVYQFNVVVDVTYATEEKTIQFFGLFRGISNALIFLFLMVSGRVLSRVGVATGLLFHPVNYLLAFASLFLRFNIFAGVYARFSTEALKTTINNPARAVLYNFFPSHVRGKVQVFLRGTVVKASALAGAGLLLLTKGILEPEMLSIVAAPLVLIWIFTNVVIKRRYASMLIQVLMDRQIDWRQLEDVNLRQLAQDKKTVETLQRGLQDENPEIVTLCAEILAQVAPPGWGKWVLEAIQAKPPRIQKRLLDMLSPEDTQELVPPLISMGRDAPAETLIHLVSTLSRLDPKGHVPFSEGLVEHPDSRVQVQALVALYESEEEEAQNLSRQRVEKLIREGNHEGLSVASEVMSETGDPAFSENMLNWARSEEPELLARALKGLSKMHLPQALEIAETSIDNPSPQVRGASVQVMIEFGEEAAPLARWIHLLADEDPQVRASVSAAIRQRGEGVVKDLIAALASPSRSLRNEVIIILDEFESPPTELSQFITTELGKTYRNLSYIWSLQEAADRSQAVSLLKDHLVERNGEIVETVMRVLAFQEFGDRMEIIRKALQTGDRRDVDNAIEALESSLHVGIRKILIPLLEDSPLEEKLIVGRKVFGVDPQATQSPATTLKILLDDGDSITQVLTIYGVTDDFERESFPAEIVKLEGSKDQLVRDAATWARRHRELDASGEKPPEDAMPLLEKVLHIRKIPIFMGLRIRELVAIAAITQERPAAQGEVVVREGDQGDVLYLVLEGELAVIKGMGSDREMTLDHIGAEDFFGEMALFDFQPRAASVVANSLAKLMVIEEKEFSRLMEHHPAIPISICKVLSQRMRTLHERFKSSSA
jgi:CRP-like cAMP-binding protein